MALFNYPGIDIFIDATLGAGGHAKLLLEHCISKEGILVGLDRDGMALGLARENLTEHSSRVHLENRPASQMAQVLKEKGYGFANGILMDLGVSSMQLDKASRGFSFRQAGPLDMRMDVRQKLTAYDVVNNYSLNDLARVLKKFGDLKNPRQLAIMIVEARSVHPIRTTEGLQQILTMQGKKPSGPGKQDVLPLVFQALRMEVNGELAELEKSLASAFRALALGGVLGVISFHSGEDRVVKRAFRQEIQYCVCPKDLLVCQCGGNPRAENLTRKTIVPGEEELKKNPRARSARLRAIRKLRNSRHAR